MLCHLGLKVWLRSGVTLWFWWAVLSYEQCCFFFVCFFIKKKKKKCVYIWRERKKSIEEDERWKAITIKAFWSAYCVCVSSWGCWKKNNKVQNSDRKKKHISRHPHSILLKKNLNLGAAIYYFHHISLSKQQLLFASLITLEWSSQVCLSGAL